LPPAWDPASIDRTTTSIGHSPGPRRCSPATCSRRARSATNPTVLYTGEQEPVAAKHFVGEVAFGYGLLITPTCDMTDQHGGGGPAHPHRVLVPVLPLALVAEQTAAVAENEMLLRSRDMIHPYMYLPPLPGVLDDESVACLFRPSLVSDALLTDPPRRIAQLQAPARRHLKVKLAAYWARVAVVDPAELPLHETRRGERPRSGLAVSRYDDPEAPVFAAPE
jgi:hypothetical protein